MKNTLTLGLATSGGNVTRPVGTKYGNVNVYSEFLSIEDMISITNGSRCGEDGDHISWSSSEWTIVGNKTRSYEVEESTLCPSKTDTKLFINGPLSAEKCQGFCKRLGNSWLVVPESTDHTIRILDFYLIFQISY